MFAIDFSDGYMAKNLPEGVTLIDVEKIEKYPRDALVIFQSFPLWNLRDIEKFDDGTKVLFWNLHPDNFYPNIFSTISTSSLQNCFAKYLLPLSFIRKKKLKKLLDYLQQRNAIVFMDGENYNTTMKYLSPKHHFPVYLPVFTQPNERIPAPIKKELVNFAWIGRICDFKYSILSHLLKRLNEIPALAGRICFTVIGDGEEMGSLKTNIGAFANLKVVLLGEVTKIHENEVLKNIDVLFAMGMSALEGAARGIPTVLLDYSYHRIDSLYKFRMSYENETYTLGREITPAFYEETSSMSELLTYISHHYATVSDLNYHWWKKNYSEEAMIQKLLPLFNGISSNIKEMKRYGFHKTDCFSILFKKLLRRVKPQTEEIGYFLKL